jgi:hypothetical protein
MQATHSTALTGLPRTMTVASATITMRQFSSSWNALFCAGRKQFQTVSNSTDRKRFQKVPTISNRFQPVPNSFKTFQTVSNGVKQLPGP